MFESVLNAPLMTTACVIAQKMKFSIKNIGHIYWRNP